MHYLLSYHNYANYRDECLASKNPVITERYFWQELLFTRSSKTTLNGQKHGFSCILPENNDTIRENSHKVTIVSELSQNTQLHSGTQTNRLASFEREPGVTSIRVENNMALVSVRFPDAIPQSRLRLLEILAQARVPINQVKLLPEGLCFVISENHASACKKLLNAEKGEVSVFGDMALISTLAGAMRDLSGVIARICEALLSASIPNRQVGDAYDAVLCLVPSVDAERAVAALREQFGLATEAIV